jgi:hypothetical protein
VLSNDDGGLNQGVARVVIERAASNIFELLIANIFRLLDFFAHIMILVGGFGWGWECSDLTSIARKTNVLPNDDGGLDQGVAGVIVERTAGNIFELLVANIFRLLDFFAHIMIWLVVLVGLGVQWVSQVRRMSYPTMTVASIRALQELLSNVPPATSSSCSSLTVSGFWISSFMAVVFYLADLLWCCFCWCRTGISERWILSREHIAVGAEEAARHVFEFRIREMCCVIRKILRQHDIHEVVCLS